MSIPMSSSQVMNPRKIRQNNLSISLFLPHVFLEHHSGINHLVSLCTPGPRCCISELQVGVHILALLLETASWDHLLYLRSCCMVQWNVSPMCHRHIRPHRHSELWDRLFFKRMTKVMHRAMHGTVVGRVREGYSKWPEKTLYSEDKHRGTRVEKAMPDAIVVQSAVNSTMSSGPADTVSYVSWQLMQSENPTFLFLKVVKHVILLCCSPQGVVRC